MDAASHGVEQAMQVLAGGARSEGRSVQAIASWAGKSDCTTRSALFSAQVDTDKLLVGTAFEPEFGQATAALARGAQVEAKARANGYAETVRLVREHYGFDIDECVPVDLRHGYQPNRAGMRKRAEDFRKALIPALEERPDAPNIFDGPVLEMSLGGYQAHVEVDTIGARSGPLLPQLEIKGWPVVDGRGEPAKVGAAGFQQALYHVGLSDLVDQLGYDPDRVVPTTGLLITPKNVGLTLIGTPVDLRTHIRRAEHTIESLPHPGDFSDQVRPELNFGKVGSVDDPEDQRLAAADELLDTFGTSYSADCSTSCGLWKLCRERAARRGDVKLAGGTIQRGAPGAPTIDAVIDMSAGGPVPDPMKHVAGRLQEAAAHLERARADIEGAEDAA